MTNFYDPLLWSAPSGVTIVQETDPEHFYTLQPNETLSMPWGITDTQFAHITATHQSFWQRQQFTVRAWPSLIPNGNSIIGAPYASQSSLSLQGSPITWDLFPVNITNIKCGIVNHWVPTNVCLWFNLRNVAGSDNRAFCHIKIDNV